jgi:hypothetical protein
MACEDDVFVFRRPGQTGQRRNIKAYQVRTVANTSYVSTSCFRATGQPVVERLALLPEDTYTWHVYTGHAYSMEVQYTRRE